MYRVIALVLGLLVIPAVADETTSAEAIKLQSLGYKAANDIRQHFESKRMKALVVEMIWACGFKDVECTASNKFKFAGHAVVVLPGGHRQVANCEATANPEETDVVSSCRLFPQNLKFNKDECTTMQEYFRYCAAEEPIDDVKCYPADVMLPGLRRGDNSLLAIEQRHHLPHSRLTPEQGTFHGLCMKVCAQEMTALQALHKFCPRTKL
ncbi:hypothetical protein [Bradyrhizobium genomosp. III]|uniref:hypothetical protein n=1 Tax=Bradyrhizobium genomosp. III TaxID=2683271 RepID=UPI00057749E6|nr:hypothetical protein [Bradyrhizobium sp. CCBAU 15635]